ncbi:MAG: TonB-dependent receptor plug domain-containing protein [Dysgonomonas sp.]|nr:TonB-dependent receptor plug domain-containing protein [Dysgonomonas sp.]
MTYTLISKRFFITLLTLFLFDLCSEVVAQNNETSISKDTVVLREVTVEQDKQRKLTGTLSGKIRLHVEGVKSLPALLGNTNLLKMLELTPGVQTSGDGNSNLYIRGGDAGQNLLLYDDVTIYSPGHLLSFFPLFNADHLSSLELVKSGVSSQYGGFLGSAILVESKRDIPSKLSIKGNIGLLSSQTTIELPIGNKFGAYISGRKTYLDLVLKPLLDNILDEKSAGDINQMDYDFWDTNITLVGKLSERNKLLINGIFSKDKLKINDDEIALNGFLAWNNTSLSAKLETGINDDLNLDQWVTFTHFRNKMHTGQAEMYIDIISKIEDFGYKNRLSYMISDIPFESGVQYEHHRVLPQETEINNAGMTYRTETLGKHRGDNLSFYTLAKFRFLPKLYTETGLRYNIFTSAIKRTEDTKTFQNIDVRIANRYQLNESVFLRLNYNHNNQYIGKLTPSSLGLPTDFWVMASSEIRPLTGDELSVGVYKSILDGMFEFSSDIYYRKMRNVSEFNQNFLENEYIPFSEKIMYGKGYAYGLETMLKKNMDKFTGWLSYSYGQSRRKFKEINNGKSFPAKYDRTHDLSLVGAYMFNDRWDASLTFVYATGNAYTQPSSWYFINNTPVKEYGQYNGVRMPDYNRMDISVNYWFKKDNGLNFSVYNMFMVKNPIYVFLLVDKDEKNGEIALKTKRKSLFSIVPSVSWKYKF